LFIDLIPFDRELISMHYQFSQQLQIYNSTFYVCI